jgi:hypothetical protein
MNLAMLSLGYHHALGKYTVLSQLSAQLNLIESPIYHLRQKSLLFINHITVTFLQKMCDSDYEVQIV